MAAYRVEVMLHDVELLDLPSPTATDLDLLDDARRHATCDRCYPAQAKLAEPFTAWCGRRAIWLYTPSGDNAALPPPNACNDCIESAACAVCGWRP